MSVITFIHLQAGLCCRRAELESETPRPAHPHLAQDNRHSGIRILKRMQFRTFLFGLLRRAASTFHPRSRQVSHLLLRGHVVFIHVMTTLYRDMVLELLLLQLWVWKSWGASAEAANWRGGDAAPSRPRPTQSFGRRARDRLRSSVLSLAAL